LGSNQPYRLVWTDHHAFCVRNILAENDWSASQIEFFVTACKSLAEHSGGSYEAVDYKMQARTDRSLRFELESMCGTLGTPDTEDAAIVKMATDFRCDLIVTNDQGLLAARVNTFVWKIEKLSDFIKAAARPAQAAA
jgi:predicted nucleic acid-binding protein